MSVLLPEVAALVEEEAAPVVIPFIEGQMTLPFAAEEAAAVGIGVTAAEFWPVLVVFGMTLAASAWLRPQLKAGHVGTHSLYGRFVSWVGNKLAQGIHLIEARVMHAMTHWLNPKIKPVTHFVNVVVHLIHGLTQDVGDLAENTHEALVWLRHHVIPQLIHKATAPLAKAALLLAGAVDSINDRLHTAAGEVADQLAAIGKTVGRTFTAAIGQLAVTVRELWQYVHHILAVEVQALRTAVDWTQAQIETVVGKVDALIDTVQTTVMPELQRIGDLLAPAAFLAAVAAAVRTSFPNLTCRNMDALGKEACAASEADMARLLGLLFGAIALADLRELTKLAQEVEHGVGVVVKETLSA